MHNNYDILSETVFSTLSMHMSLEIYNSSLNVTFETCHFLVNLATIPTCSGGPFT